MRSVCLLVVLALGACKAERSPGASSGSVEPGRVSPGADASAATDSDDAQGAPPDCGTIGRLWDGKHEGCLYEVGGCCYDTPEAACTAAGCGGTDCRVLESAPAQIFCDGV
jgi:hypothetical protein